MVVNKTYLDHQSERLSQLPNKFGLKRPGARYVVVYLVARCRPQFLTVVGQSQYCNAGDSCVNLPGSCAWRPICIRYGGQVKSKC